MERTLFLLSECSFCQAMLPRVGGAVSQHKNRQLKNLEVYSVSGTDTAKPFRVTFFEGDHLSQSRPAVQKHPALTHTWNRGAMFSKGLSFWVLIYSENPAPAPGFEYYGYLALGFLALAHVCHQISETWNIGEDWSHGTKHTSGRKWGTESLLSRV